MRNLVYAISIQAFRISLTDRNTGRPSYWIRYYTDFTMVVVVRSLVVTVSAAAQTHGRARGQHGQYLLFHVEMEVDSWYIYRYK